ncbi:MAG TPA: hypothetical protein VN364_05755 [Bellilinea sp.]|nr:hypothetical protein [Bellilinea sp.]
MSQTPDLSTPEAAHRHFSVYCFNLTWDLLDKTDRTSEDDEAMVQACLASLWHWSQRSDCTDQNKSIGAWQAARVYAVLKLPEIARRYGKMALEFARHAPPFYQAYAYEALARSEAIAGNHALAQQYLEQSRVLTQQVEEVEERTLTLEDLKTI